MVNEESCTVETDKMANELEIWENGQIRQCLRNGKMSKRPMQERNGQMTNWSMRKDGEKAEIAKMVNRLAKRLDKMVKEKRWEYTDKTRALI